jgi:hypothetical protein
MSEKKLREIAKGYWQLLDGLGVLGFHGGEETAWVVEEIERQLAGEPDVVKVLRKAKEMLVKVDTDLADKSQNIVTYDQLVGMQNTLDEIIRWLEEIVHLTETGWEWTDD